MRMMSLLTLALLICWARSLYCLDEVEISRDSHYCSVSSNRQCLIFGKGKRWESYDRETFEAEGLTSTTWNPEHWRIDPKAGRVFRKESYRIRFNTGEPPLPWSEIFRADFDSENENRFRFLGLDLGFERGRITTTYGWLGNIYVVPYAWIVVSLLAMTGTLAVCNSYQKRLASKSSSVQ